VSDAGADCRYLIARGDTHQAAEAAGRADFAADLMNDIVTDRTVVPPSVETTLSAQERAIYQSMNGNPAQYVQGYRGPRRG